MASRIQVRIPFLRRLRYLLIIFLLRVLTRYKIFTNKLFDKRVGLVPKSRSIAPARKIWIQSSVDPRRKIEAHVFEPHGTPMAKSPLPVHINLHGSGFVLPNMGEDSEQCAYWASTLGCIVIDADYVKSPEYKHPSAVIDALDIATYIHSNPEKFDARRLTIGGVSAGGSVAILAALRAPKNTFKSVIAWCPITDFSLTEEERLVPPLPVGAPGFDLPWSIIHMFLESVCPPGLDLRDPSISALYAPSQAFPPIAFIVGENDPLCRDSVEITQRLKDDGVDCELALIANAGHAFDRAVIEGTPQWDARRDANKMVERRLSAAHRLPL